MTRNQNERPSGLRRRRPARPWTRPLLAVLLGGVSMGLGACGGGSTADQVAGGSFVLIRTEPANNSRVYLNQVVQFTFSNPIDLSTVNFNSVIFTARNELGDPVPETVVGTFGLGTDLNGQPDPRVLTFSPRLPTNDNYSDGGFRPGRTYEINFAGSGSTTAQTMRDVNGRSLSADSPIKRIRLEAPSGSDPSQLFLDRQVGGPRVVATTVTPLIGSRVSLNKLGDLPVEVRVRFNQPVDPSSINVPKNQNQDPLEAKRRQKGKVYLAYDDPEYGPDIWIRAQVELESNDVAGAVVVLRPDGVLPNNATVRVIVLPEFRDIAGETNVRDASYRPVVASFQTEEAFETQFDAIALDFNDEDLFEATASFRDPVAELTQGVLRASFDFEGLDSPFDYGPTSDVVLNTEYTVVRPKNGNDLPVTGGVFAFRNIEVPKDVTVSASGPNPLVFLATGDVSIDGTLKVDGGDGEGATAINSANLPSKGGVGNAGGGDGGRGSIETNKTTAQGERGFGPGRTPGQGGEGGRISCGPIQAGHKGSGGGGGSFATQGDNDFYTHSANSIVQGQGGEGLNLGTETVDGGRPGPVVFDDENPNNDFWGRQVTKDGTVYLGELASPRGGNGGGGGGDRTAANCDAGPAAFFNDERGGGGGAGGGILIIKALGTIEIGPTGLISARGGHGGGGEPNASNAEGGGGGGGSGGMVILMSANKITIEQHGGQWKAPTRDSSFGILADGGIGLSRPNRLSKYDPANSGAANRGGFGGMGVVQLMVPPGDDQVDKTGDVQDDNIEILKNQSPVNDAAQKLAWLYEGDIRPRPIVMPVPFSRYSQARTRWILTGDTVRREVPNTGPGARAILSPPGVSGPAYFFSGLQDQSSSAPGYVKIDPNTGAIDFEQIEFLNQQKVAPIAGAITSGTYRGQPVWELPLGQALLPADGRYANYRAFLRNAADEVISEFRIAGHASSVLFLDSNDGAAPQAATRVSVHAKFFDVYTNEQPGLGEPFLQASQLHAATTFKLGFAFHKDPSEPDTTGGPGTDKNRFPQNTDEFVYDLGAAASSIASGHYPFAKIQVRFNLNYNPTDPDSTPGPNLVNPTKTKRPEIRKLALPYRF